MCSRELANVCAPQARLSTCFLTSPSGKGLAKLWLLFTRKLLQLELLPFTVCKDLLFPLFPLLLLQVRLLCHLSHLQMFLQCLFLLLLML